ncbi:YeeE/YedE family protein [bacterium]|nr:YeeE/YedE family protein [bacterium]
MTPFPLQLTELMGHWGSYWVYLAIGFAFGYVLEIAGFGNSLKLSAQFYFKDLTVLKVMFTAIIVAMVLVFGSTALGLLDFNLIWVNPTYLWPGIVGGLIMGAGFIVGGFCPGTSLVSAATGKLDGIMFALGVFFGIFLFGETVGLYEGFWHSSYMGRFILPDLFGVETGWVVLGVVLMALFMFWGGEQLERIIGKQDLSKAPKWRYGAAGTLVLASVAILFIGQPTNADRWSWLAPAQDVRLAERQVQIHPAELLETLHNRNLRVVMLDVRSEADYNLFHILDARHVTLDELPALAPSLREEPDNTVFVTMSNDESAATEAWKYLVAESIPNLYILEGGVNNWLAVFSEDEFRLTRTLAVGRDDQLRYAFDMALGARQPAAEPDPHDFVLEYVPKIELKSKRGATGGGCG